MKTCTKCHKRKQANFFHKDKYRPDGLTMRCIKCRKEDYLDKLEENRARSRKYQSDNPDKGKSYRAKVRAIDPKFYARLQAEWVKNNPEKAKETARNFLAKKLVKNPGWVNYATALSVCRRKKSAPKWLSETQLAEILLWYDQAKELQWLSEDKLTVDHIIPLNGEIVSGLHVPWNLQILTNKQNSKKSNKFG